MQQDQQNQPQPPPAAAAAAGPQPMNPRLNGLLLFGLGLALEGFNGFTLVNDSTYYPKLLMVGFVLMPLGGWTMVTGIAWDKNATVKPPTWWTAGAVILCLLGLAAGIGATFLLSE
jgi:hypothetical protein